MSITSEFASLGSLSGLGSRDLHADDLNPKDRPGRYAYMVDAFGTRIFQYGRNCIGSAITMGECLSRMADISVTALTSGSTTTAVKAGIWTANKSVGELLYCLDNNDSAGAAPEGEISPIVANTTGIAICDANYAFSVALAANDTGTTVSPGWHWIASAIGDKAQEVKGIAVGKDGITDLYYGWAQCYGICPVTQIKAATAQTDRAAIIADTAKVTSGATSAWELCIGYTLGAISADIVNDYSTTFINVYAPTLNAGTP